MKTSNLISQKSKKRADELLSNTPQFLLIVGGEGIGKKELADYLTSNILQLSKDKIHNHPYYLEISPTNSSIGIDEIRKVGKFLELASTGSKSIRRVIVIENANLLTSEAQNAFLKTLEEPPEDTAIIFTTTSKNTLLPTIISRSMVFEVSAPTVSEINNHFIELGYEPSEVSRSMNIYGLLPRKIHEYLNKNDTESDILMVAKEILTSSKYERLLRVDELSKNYVLTDITEGINTILGAAKTKALKDADDKRLASIMNSKSVIQKLSDSKGISVNNKLAYTYLMLNI